MGTRAFEEGPTRSRSCAALAPATAPAPAKPLRQFLESLDDRRRAIDERPARRRGRRPPASDPSSNRGGDHGGFTGLEALWNYFFWQGLSINGFDDVGHVLRLSVDASASCTPATRTTRR